MKVTISISPNSSMIYFFTMSFIFGQAAHSLIWHLSDFFFTSFNPWKNNQSLHGIFSTALIMIFWWTWLNVWKTTMLQFTSFYLYVWMFFLKWLICFIKIEKHFFLHRFYSPLCTIKTKAFITGSCLDMSSLWWNSCTRFKVSCRKSCLCAHCFLLFCRAGNI